MYCSRCGGENDADARYCEKCGADLISMPKPIVPGTPNPAAPPAPLGPPVPYAPRPAVYAPGTRHAWWYPIGVWVILSGFFAFLDVVGTGRLTWSVYPIGVLGIFMVGFPLLNLLEGRAATKR